MSATELPINDKTAPLPEVLGGFRTIMADPPWRFANRTGKVAPEHRRLDRYSTMPLSAIKEMGVAGVAARDAHLYLWVPNALLPDGLAVMEAWGFRYVSNMYFCNVTEILLFGVRGSMRTLQPGRSQVNMIESRKREHSRKPDEQYDLMESCSPGPRLALFSRYPRDGWVGWGDESAEDVVPRGAPSRKLGSTHVCLPAG